MGRGGIGSLDFLGFSFRLSELMVGAVAIERRRLEWSARRSALKSKGA